MADRWRPDPDQGVFETMLVVGGRPVELDAHLARLEASLAVLFPSDAAPDLREALEDRAEEIESGSVRAAVAPAGPDGRMGLRAEIEPRQGLWQGLGPFFPHSGHKGPTTQIPLQSFALAGGLGPHKWADRSLLDAAQTRLPGDTLPLIVDNDGAVLEVSRANVFVVRDGAIFTPPLDGRILPGVTRMRALEIAANAGVETHEAALHRDDLLGAGEVFLTGSVRGVEPVASLDGVALSGSGQLAGELAAGLRRAWLGAGRSPSAVG